MAARGNIPAGSGWWTKPPTRAGCAHRSNLRRQNIFHRVSVPDAGGPWSMDHRAIYKSPPWTSWRKNLRHTPDLRPGRKASEGEKAACRVWRETALYRRRCGIAAVKPCGAAGRACRASRQLPPCGSMPRDGLVCDDNRQATATPGRGTRRHLPSACADHDRYPEDMVEVVHGDTSKTPMRHGALRIAFARRSVGSAMGVGRKRSSPRAKKIASQFCWKRRRRDCGAERRCVSPLRAR